LCSNYILTFEKKIQGASAPFLCAKFKQLFENLTNLLCLFGYCGICESYFRIIQEEQKSKSLFKISLSPHSGFLHRSLYFVTWMFDFPLTPRGNGLKASWFAPTVLKEWLIFVIVIYRRKLKIQPWNPTAM
jgi:hypothetical protein